MNITAYSVFFDTCLIREIKSTKILFEAYRRNLVPRNFRLYGIRMPFTSYGICNKYTCNRAAA